MSGDLWIFDQFIVRQLVVCYGAFDDDGDLLFAGEIPLEDERGLRPESEDDLEELGQEVAAEMREAWEREYGEPITELRRITRDEYLAFQDDDEQEMR